MRNNRLALLLAAGLALTAATPARADTTETTDDPTAVVTVADASPFSGLGAGVLPTGDAVTVAAVATPVAALSPVRAGAADARRLPVSILGQAGGSELLGGLIAVYLAFRYARFRRLI